MYDDWKRAEQLPKEARQLLVNFITKKYPEQYLKKLKIAVLTGLIVLAGYVWLVIQSTAWVLLCSLVLMIIATPCYIIGRDGGQAIRIHNQIKNNQFEFILETLRHGSANGRKYFISEGLLGDEVLFVRPLNPKYRKTDSFMVLISRADQTVVRQQKWHSVLEWEDTAFRKQALADALLLADGVLLPETEKFFSAKDYSNKDFLPEPAQIPKGFEWMLSVAEGYDIGYESYYVDSESSPKHVVDVYASGMSCRAGNKIHSGAPVLLLRNSRNENEKVKAYELKFR